MCAKRISIMKQVLRGLMLLGMLLLLPAMASAEYENENAGTPPIGQTLVREGDFAVRLATSLSLGTSLDEVEAENLLSEVGIAPKNGWIADYPVTPDIVDELHRSVRDAAAGGRINLGIEAALLKLNEVMVQSGLALDTQAATPEGGGAEQAEPPSYPSPTVINNYYQSEGPPVVTYYAPPADYYYMYGWVPHPFWYSGLFFPGFFILHDFHRTVFIDNRTVFVSNHFRDIGRQRIIRLDPIERSRGNNIANTRVIRTRTDFTNRGPVRERAIVRETGAQTVPNSGPTRPTVNRVRGNSGRSDFIATPPAANGAAIGNPSRGSRIRGSGNESRAVGFGVTSGSGSGFGNPSSRSGRSVSVTRSESAVIPFVGGNGSSGISGRGDRMMSMPPRGGGNERMPFRGNSSGSGGGGRGRR
jgi:hypothetical protein